LTNWKTTLAGILSAFLAVVGPLTAYLAEHNNATATDISGGLTVAAAIARIVLGIMQKDAGTVQAIVPGSVTPQAVPSHEVPDSPAATPVKEAQS
jgi:hypothetical protein